MNKLILNNGTMKFILVILILTSQPVSAWYDTDWQYRKEITIDYSKVSADLTNFPGLIDITDSDLQSRAQSNGNDILFTDSSDNKLDHEIEFYESGTGHLIAWVNVLEISSTEDTTIYMYYGNSGASNQEDPEGTWDPHYIMVQHLKETSDTHYDSTSYNNDGTPNNGVNQDAPGKIAGADSFDGSNDHINCGNDASLDITGNLTVEAWVKFNSVAGTQRFISKRSADDGHLFQWYAGDTLQGGIKKSGTWKRTVYSWDPEVGTWYHLAYTYDGTDIKLYVNGELKDTYSTTVGIGSTTNPLLLGCFYDINNCINGIMDEVRISTVARSDVWISTSYNNQKDPSTFYTVVSQYPVVSDEYPENASTDVELNPTLYITVEDYQSDLMNVTFRSNASGSWDDIGVHENVGNGAYNCPTTNMSQYNTTYYWSVNASDGEHSTYKEYSFTTKLPDNPEPYISDEYPVNGAVDVPVSLSELSFNLTDYQGDSMNYTVTTSPDIGSDSVDDVYDGTFSVSVSGLSYDTTYTWNVTVTDGTYWTNETFTFSTES